MVPSLLCTFVAHITFLHVFFLPPPFILSLSLLLSLSLSLSLLSLSLSLSLPPLSLCGCKIHVIWCPLRNILFLINLTFFHAKSCHSSYKLHQPFTDYFLRLPYSEMLEKRVFRSRANRRLVFRSDVFSHCELVFFARCAERRSRERRVIHWALENLLSRTARRQWQKRPTLKQPSANEKLKRAAVDQKWILRPSSEGINWILRTSSSCSSCYSSKMENRVIFHFTLQIQILTMFSVHSQHSKKRKNMSLVKKTNSFPPMHFFFRPTPDGSRQVVYQAGKTIAFCKFTELGSGTSIMTTMCLRKRTE